MQDPALDNHRTMQERGPFRSSGEGSSKFLNGDKDTQLEATRSEAKGIRIRNKFVCRLKVLHVF